MLVKEAPVVWNSLRSIICVYKPSGVSCRRVRETIINSLCRGLNEMECRPPTDYVSIEGNPLTKLTVTLKPNLADHPLVTGPRYIEEDLKCSWSNFLGHNTNGVLILGLKRGTAVAKSIRENYPTRAYHITGKLGEATDTGFKDGKVIEKSTWKYITETHINNLLSVMQASHQKQMFKSCGVDLQSQTAYDLACEGPIRPADSKMPIIYGLKCVGFDPPNFKIEIQCVNEYESYLKNLIHEIGLKLHSTAHCEAIQCIRHCHFTLNNALLRKHWTLQHILTNMEECEEIMRQNSNILSQKRALLQ